MKPSQKHILKTWIAAVLWLILITLESSSLGSAANTSRFVYPLLHFLIGLDPTLEVANGYTVRALPSSFLIDRTGNTVAIALGPRDWDGTAAHAIVESLLK